MRGRVAAEVEDCGRRLGRDHDETHRPARHPGAHLERVEPVADPQEVRGTVRLRHHDPVEPRRDDRREVVEREAGVERIDPHPEAPVARPARVEGVAHEAARGRLVLRRDRVLEVEDQRVGAGALRAGEFPLAVAGGEEE